MGYDKETLDLIRSLLRIDGDRLVWKVDRSTKAKAGTMAGHQHEYGYRVISINRRTFREHVIIFALTYGQWPNGQIDHINGIRNDNRIDNLRLTTSQGNNKNRKIPITNRSGVMGVCMNKKLQKWTVQINKGYEQIYLGVFADFFEACCRRKSAEIQFGYHPNHGRKGILMARTEGEEA